MMNDCIYPLRPSGQPPGWMEGVLLFLKEWRLAFPDLPPDESFNMYDLAAYAKYSKIGR